jgi:hypothetical protein
MEVMLATMLNSMKDSQAAFEKRQEEEFDRKLKLLQESLGPMEDSPCPEESRQPPIQGSQVPPSQVHDQSQSLPPSQSGQLPNMPHPDSDDTFENECRTRAEQHAKRRGVIKNVLKESQYFSFDISDVQSVSEAQQAMLGMAPKTPDAVTMPIQQAIADQVHNSALTLAHLKKTGKKPKHEAIFKRLYKIPEDQQDYWDFPAPPPQELVNATEPSKFQTTKKGKVLSSSLSRNSARETALLESIHRAQLGFKMGNCLALSLIAGIKLLKKIEVDVKQFITEEDALPEKRQLDSLEMSALGSSIVNQIEQVQSCFTEAQVNSADILKSFSFQFVQATQERRDLWVEESDLAPDQRETLKQQPIPTPPIKHPEDYPAWDFIGSLGRSKIVDWQAAAVARSHLTRSAPSYSRKPGTQSQRSNRRRQNNKNRSKPQSQNKQPPKESKPSQNTQSKQPFRGKKGGRFNKNPKKQ